MNQTLAVNTIIAGRIFFETIINQEKKISNNQPGGEVLYTAAGFNLWNKHAGLIAKISEGFSIDWIQEIDNFQINTLGIINICEDFNQLRFYAIENSDIIHTENPQKHFFNIGSSLPKSLLGYQPPHTELVISKSASPFSIKPDDFPSDFLLANNLILCPTDFFSQNLVPPFFRTQTNGNVILCASTQYMHPSLWNEIPPLIKGSSVFLATEAQVKSLFLGRMEDIWEMAEFLFRCGVEIVAIFGNERSLYLYDGYSGKKYFIPSYPVHTIDPIGTFAAFCGGFGAGFTTHFDPLKAGLMGVVAASINVEGSTPFHTFHSLPGLAAARLEALENSVELI